MRTAESQIADTTRAPRLVGMILQGSRLLNRYCGPVGDC